MEKEEVTFCQNRLPCMAFLVFKEMRENGELCDVTLKLQHSTVMAHRVVLAAGIPYFRSLFTKNADETEEKELHMANLDPNALESLIHFAYSSKVNISIKNVHSLLLASDFLQLSEVMDACVEFISGSLHVYNILEVCTLAQNINNGKLTEICNNYIQQNFEEFSKSKDFLSLPYQSVKTIISQDELNVFDEETVFEAVINWVKFSPPEREGTLLDLLREVRMTSFPVNYLVKRVANEELVRGSTACRDLIQDVQSFHLLSEREKVSLNLNRAPGRKKKRMYAICNSASYGYSVYCCDFANETWQKLKSDKSYKDKILRVVACNENIYAFLENELKMFCPKTLEWDVLEPTHEHIEGSAVMTFGNLIYVFGSLNRSSHDKVRCFDTRLQRWLKGSKMENGRANVATASMKETIYVTGGYWSSELFNIAEKYNPSKGEWCQIPSMLTSRSLHGCVTINRKIYVFGGCTRSSSYVTYSHSGEMYDPFTNLWNAISSMRIARNRFSFGSYNEKIYVFGGETENKSSRLQGEFYDPNCDQWNFSCSVPEGFARAVAM